MSADTTSVSPATTTLEARPRGIELQYAGGQPAKFRLLWEEAPQTCRAVVDHLPEEGECVHGIYSGTVVGFFFDPTVAPPLENATSIVGPGDLLFTHYDEQTRHGHLDGLTELYWPYDRYARPTIPGQFVTYVSPIVGSFEGSDAEWADFAERSRDIRYHGGQKINVRLY